MAVWVLPSGKLRVRSMPTRHQSFMLMAAKYPFRTLCAFLTPVAKGNFLFSGTAAISEEPSSYPSLFYGLSYEE